MLPPEINWLRMFLGAGSAPMLEAAVAWDGLAAELATAASSLSVTSGLAEGAWQGAASAAMMAKAGPYAGFLSAAANQAQSAAAQAKAVAAVFEAAQAATVSPGDGRVQSHRPGVAGGIEPVRSERPGDRGHRGRIRADVGPGRRRVGRLPLRRVRSGRPVGAVASPAINTGLFNSGDLNTGVGYLLDGPGQSSGFGNLGIGSSGFSNVGDGVSGVGNSGDYISGVFNKGLGEISGIMNVSPNGFASGIDNLRDILAAFRP